MPEKKEELPRLLDSLIDKIAGVGKEKDKASFVTMLVLVGIVAFIVSITSIRLAMVKRQAAELAVQVRRAEEEKNLAREKLKLSCNAAERQEAQEEIKALSKEVLKLKAQISRRQVEHQETVEELQALTSWDGVVVVDGRDGK